MSDSADVGPAWSAGVEITKRTQFQAVIGTVWIATGATAPTKNIAGNAIPAGRAVEIDAGETVYWRTDEAAPVKVSWLGTGA
jgi:hypothetical protein